jgi:hypothetical protein
MAFYSSGVEYGIHSLMCMVDSKGDARDMSVREIAELQSVPYDYLAKILPVCQRPGWCAALRARAAASSWRNLPSTLRCWMWRMPLTAISVFLNVVKFVSVSRF